MKKNAWKRRIIEQMEQVGTYKDAHLPIIETCAEILARRDEALKQWRDEGSIYMSTFTSDRGATNQKKNPLLGVVQEHEKDALSYWTALGLTPQSMKKQMQEEKQEEEKLSPLAKALLQVSHAEKS